MLYLIKYASSGPLNNMLFFQDRTLGNTSVKNAISGGTTAQLTGVLYFPTTELDYTGGSATNVPSVGIVADILVFSGSSYLKDGLAGRVVVARVFKLRGPPLGGRPQQTLTASIVFGVAAGDPKKSADGAGAPVLNRTATRHVQVILQAGGIGMSRRSEQI